MGRYKFLPYEKFIFMRDSVDYILQNHAFFHMQTTFPHIQTRNKTTIIRIEIKLGRDRMHFL